MLTYLWIIDLYIIFFQKWQKKKVHDNGDSDPPPTATFPDKKGKKKNKNKDSEVRSHSLEPSATEKSPAPSRSRGKRYVLPKFSVILVFNSLLLLFTKLHLCNTSSNNKYSNSFLSSFQFR